MKRLYSILIIIFISIASHAQPYETNPDFKRTYHWMFGDSVWLDFNHTPPLSRDGSQLSAIEPSASYSDENGNLIIYSDGITVWNKNHQIIENGSGILGHSSSSQGAIIVPLPNRDSILYLFTTDAGCGNNGLRYSVIRLHENPDSIYVKEKNVFVANGLTESINVTKHENNIDFWIVVHSSIGNTFYSYLLTENGLTLCPVTTQIGYMFDGHFFNCQTKGDFNLGGSKFVLSLFRDDKVMTLDFSNRKGEFSTYKQYDNIIIPTGLTFSTDNTYIYVVERDKGIRRINLVNNSYDTITQINAFDYFIIQTALAPNGDIYCNVFDSSHVAIISNVNNETPDFNLKVIFVGNKRLTNGLPNFVKSYFYTPSINFTMKLNCVYNTIQFHGQDTFSSTSHDWLITKQGITMTGNIKNPLIEFTDTGVYQVRYIASSGSRSDTIFKEVEILPKIEKNFLGNDTGWCNSIGVPIELHAPNGMYCYEWSTEETSPQISADTAGVYIVKITTPNFCVLFDTIKVSVDTVKTVESGFLGEDKFWCESLDTIVKLKAPNDFLKYLWSNGSKEQEIVISDEGVYFVEALKRNQCTSGGDFFAYDTIDVSLLNAPPKPTLDRMDDSLFTNISGNYTYEWYRNNTILNDTGSYLILSDTGYYFLKVINENNCVNYSDTIHVVTLGIDNPLFNSIKLYPNPTEGVFNIEVLNGFYSFEIIDVKGKLIKKGKLTSGANQIDISHFVDGIYFITIQNNEQTITYKIIKQTE